MQFIKPTHIQRLLKLKTSEDIKEWREERKINFPTRAKRDESNLKMKQNESDQTNRSNQFNKNENKFGQKSNKFNKGKFNKNKLNNKQNNKRPFNKEASSSNESNIEKVPKLNNETNVLESNSLTETNLDQQINDQPVNSNQIDNQNIQKDNQDRQKNRCNQNDQPNKFKRKRQPTLLEKMLLTDIKRNEDAIFKCLELIVDSNYLSNDQK